MKKRKRRRPSVSSPLRLVDVVRQIRRPWARDPRTQVHSSQPSRGRRKEKTRKEVEEQWGKEGESS